MKKMAMVLSVLFTIGMMSAPISAKGAEAVSDGLGIPEAGNGYVLGAPEIPWIEELDKRFTEFKNVGSQTMKLLDELELKVRGTIYSDKDSSSLRQFLVQTKQVLQLAHDKYLGALENFGQDSYMLSGEALDLRRKVNEALELIIVDFPKNLEKAQELLNLEKEQRETAIYKECLVAMSDHDYKSGRAKEPDFKKAEKLLNGLLSEFREAGTFWLAWKLAYTGKPENLVKAKELINGLDEEKDYAMHKQLARYNLIVHGYTRAGMMEEAFRELQELTAMYRDYGKTRQAPTKIAILQEMAQVVARNDAQFAAGAMQRNLARVMAAISAERLCEEEMFFRKLAVVESTALQLTGKKDVEEFLAANGFAAQEMDKVRAAQFLDVVHPSWTSDGTTDLDREIAQMVQYAAPHVTLVIKYGEEDGHLRVFASHHFLDEEGGRLFKEGAKHDAELHDNLHHGADQEREDPAKPSGPDV